MSKRALRRVAIGAAVVVAAAVAFLFGWGERIVVQHPFGRQVIFVGLDGADWQLLDGYMADGAMPNLAALAREGRPGVLLTAEPPLSPLVWTTMMTGVGPLRHGILDFTRFHPTTGAREPITSAERRVPAVWDMASEAGRRVAVFGLWATWPAEPVRGLVVSDRLFSFQDPGAAPAAGIVYPPTEEAWARRALAAAETSQGFSALAAYLPWLDEAEYGRRAGGPNPYADPVGALRRILVETEVYDRLAQEWIARERPDLSIVYFQGSDAVGHVFAPFLPPALPGVDPAEARRFGGVPRAYFADLDRRLGRYRDLARAQGAVLMLASDHGFRWQEGRPAGLASATAATAGLWHREEGIYLLWGPGIAPAPRAASHGRIDQVCATLLALLGTAPAAGIAGPSLPGAFSPADSERPAVRYERHFTPDRSARAAATEAAPSAAAGEDLEKLAALGYLGHGEPARRPRSGPGGDPTRTAGSYNNEGLLLRAAGRPAAAVDAFERALALDPANASALWNLSELLAAEGNDVRDLDRADDLLIRAVEAGLPQGEPRLLARLANHRRRGAGARAARLCDAGIAALPASAPLRLLRGRLRMASGECRGALADFTAAQRLTPGDPLAWGSAALPRLCLGDRAGAARDLERSLVLDPDQPELRRTLAEIGTGGG